MVSTTDVAISGRQRGGLKAVRPGVWLIDVELPSVGNERRRRVSRTLACSEAEARAALAVLIASADGAPPSTKSARPVRPVSSSRKRGSGSIYEPGPGPLAGRCRGAARSGVGAMSSSYPNGEWRTRRRRGRVGPREATGR